MALSLKHNWAAIERKIQTLETKLINEQLEGNLETEFRLCLLLGKLYELIGDFQRSLEFYTSAYEISNSLENNSFRYRSISKIMWISKELKLCEALISPYLNVMYESKESINSELGFFILSSLFFEPLRFCLFNVSFLEFKKRASKKWSLADCYEFGEFMFFSIITQNQDNQHFEIETELNKYSKNFSCRSCDLADHIRIFHILGDLCIARNLLKLAGSFYDMAYSLSSRDEFTDVIYVKCLLKYVKLYALEGNNELAWSTFYLCKDIATSLSLYESEIANVQKSLYSVETFESLYSMKAFNTMLGKYLDSKDEHHRTKNQKYIVEALLFCGIPSICLEYAATLDSLNFKKRSVCTALLDFMAPSIFHSFRESDLVKDENLGDIVVSRGLLALKAGDMNEFGKYYDEYCLIVESKCLSLNHDHSFSYFTTRGASKKVARLVDGFKMSSVSKKHKGLAINPTDHSKLQRTECDIQQNRKNYSVNILVGNMKLDYTISWDKSTVSTVGWLKSQVCQNIHERFHIIGRVSLFKEDNEVLKDDYKFLSSVLFGISETTFQAWFTPISIDTLKLCEKFFSDRMEGKDYIAHNLLIDERCLRISYLENLFTEGLYQYFASLSQIVPPDFKIFITSCCVDQRILDFAICSNYQLQGNNITLENPRFESQTSFNLAFNSLQGHLFSHVILNDECKSLCLAECDMLLDLVPKVLPKLKHLDLSFNHVHRLSRLFDSICERCPNLRELRLNGITYSEDETFEEPSQLAILRSLEVLSLGFNRGPCVGRNTHDGSPLQYTTIKDSFYHCSVPHTSLHRHIFFGKMEHSARPDLSIADSDLVDARRLVSSLRQQLITLHQQILGTSRTADPSGRLTRSMSANLQSAEELNSTILARQAELNHAEALLRLCEQQAMETGGLPQIGHQNTVSRQNGNPGQLPTVSRQDSSINSLINRLPPYSKQDPQTYVEDFEYAARLAMLQEDHKTFLFFNLLPDSPVKDYVRPWREQSWDLFKHHFVSFLSSPIAVAKAEQELLSFRRHSQEDVETCAQRLRTLCGKAKRSTEDSLIIQQFLSCLPDDLYRVVLAHQVMNQLSFEQLVITAKTFEDTITLRKPKGSSAPTQNSKSTKNPYSEDDRKQVDELKSKGQKLYCAYPGHGEGYHSTEQCRAMAKMKKSEKPNSTAESTKASETQAKVVRVVQTQWPDNLQELSVIINGQKFSAVPDTGAMVSLMTKETAEKLNLKVQPANIELLGFDRRMTVRATSKVEVDVAVTSDPVHTSKITFYVSDGWRQNVLIGSPDLEALSVIGPRTIPGKKPVHTISNDPQDDASDPFPTVPAQVADLLSANESLNPATPCNLPEAVVPIPTGDAPPAFVAQYPLADAFQQPVADTIAELLQTGIIEPAASECPFNNPILAVNKPDGSIRMCLDPRALNQTVVADSFPIPTFDTLSAKMVGKTWFSKLDLKQGYHQLVLAPADRHKTCFTWAHHRYQYCRAPFGLKHLPELFQRLMDLSVLAEHKAYALAYIDDIIIFSNSFDEHVEHVRTVLTRLTDTNLRVNPKKCLFFQPSMEFLGFIVSATGTSPAPDKLQGLQDLVCPRTIKEVQQFLGFANFLARHVPHFANLAEPFFKLLRKDTDPALFDAPETFEAFDKLKAALYNAFARSYIQPKAQLVVEVDASRTGLGAILAQEIAGSLFPVDMRSRTLTPAEKNYSVFRLELAGLLFALSKFRNQLLMRPFLLLTDHKSLTNLDETEITPWIANILDTISIFDFTIRHKPGSENVLADYLSRQLPKAYINTVTIDAAKIVANAHAIGHFGAPTLMLLLKEQGYSFPNLHQLCKQAVRSCHTCASFDNVDKRPMPLQPVSSDAPFHHVQMDLIELPRFKRWSYVLTVVDVNTKFTLLEPLASKRASAVAAPLKKLLLTFGIPAVIQSDNGREFINATLDALADDLGFKHVTSTPYHPQTNGIVERKNQDIKTILSRIMADLATTDWVNLLPVVQMAINLRPSRRLQLSPFQSLFLRHPWRGGEAPPEESAAQIWALIGRVDESIRSDEYTSVDRRAHAIAEPLPEGTVVFAEKKISPPALEPRNEGPLTVTRAKADGRAYELSNGSSASRVDLRPVAQQ